MPLDMEYPIVVSPRQIKLDRSLEGNNSDWVVWFYSWLSKGRLQGHQPDVNVVFRQLLSENKVSDEVIHRRVPLTWLGQLRIGSVWTNGLSRKQIQYTREEFDVDFTQGMWRTNSVQQAVIRNWSPLFPESLHPTGYYPDKNNYLEFHLNHTGGKLLIPCVEFFMRCFGRSGYVKRILTTAGWEQAKKSLYAPLDEPIDSNSWTIRLHRRLYNGDTIMLTHGKYDTYTEYKLKSVYSQLESTFQHDRNNQHFLNVQPWHQGPAKLIVRGKWFNNQKSFLALQIIGCSEPAGLPISRDRENRNKVEEHVDGPGEAWSGAKGGRIQSFPPIIDLTPDQEPDHSAGTIELLDPDFEVPGLRRVILDRNLAQVQDSAGPRVPSNDPGDTFSTELPYGDKKGVGEASVHAKEKHLSEGMLMDMWNALLYLHSAYPEQVRSVKWYSFDDGLHSSSPPKVIPLKPYDDEELEKYNPNQRNWLYLDTRNGTVRGALVIEVITPQHTLYIVEIERRVSQTLPSSSKEKIEYKEENLSGLVFRLNSPDELNNWLRFVLCHIRNAAGVFSRLTAHCPGVAYDFRHSSSSNDEVACHSAALNALNKIR